MPSHCECACDTMHYMVGEEELSYEDIVGIQAVLEQLGEPLMEMTGKHKRRGTYRDYDNCYQAIGPKSQELVAQAVKKNRDRVRSQARVHLQNEISRLRDRQQQIQKDIDRLNEDMDLLRRKGQCDG